MKSTIKILQAKYGDAICIRFLGNDGNYHNIFIDGGFRDTYKQTLRKETLRVKDAGEKIDLFIITHTDQDHISGVLQFIKEFGQTDLVQQYWYNYSKMDVEVPSKNENISIAQGIKLRDFLIGLERLPEEKISSDIQERILFGAKLTVLSPTIADLDRYEELWQKEEIESAPEGLISSRNNDYSTSIDQLSQKEFREDSKLENRVSIAFVFENQGTSAIFLADTHPSTIVSSLKKLGYSPQNKLIVDYVKLSHHGSKSNTSPELLTYLDCVNYISSANGKNRYNFPHKEALSRILTQPGRGCSRKINFIFNYNNDLIRSIFTDYDYLEHNFCCSYPPANEYGYTIQF